MKNLFILPFVLLCTFGLSAQSWMDEVLDQNRKFDDVTQQLDESFKLLDNLRGTGFKQYQRWRYFNQSRLTKDGLLPNPDHTYSAWLNYKSNNNRMLNNVPASQSPWQERGHFSWENTQALGGNPGIGRVNVVENQPGSTSILYIGTPAGGIWKTTNGGNSWTPLFEEQITLGVSAIAIDPNNVNCIYVGTGDADALQTPGIGLMKSTDGGQTWAQIGLGAEAGAFHKLIIDPTNANKIFAATHEGLYRSDDAGQNWVQLLNERMFDIEFKPNDPNVVYASSTRFFKSTDGGNSFQHITNGLPNESLVIRAQIAVSKANSNMIYLLAGDRSNGFLGMYRSTNSGTSFTTRATDDANTPNILGYNDPTLLFAPRGQAIYDLALEVDPSNANRLYTGGIVIFESTDGGQDYTQITSWKHPSEPNGYCHADIHSIKKIGSNYFIGSDGGIFKYRGSPVKTFTDLSEDIGITQYYDIIQSPHDNDQILTGSQDNGSNLMDGTHANHMRSGDGMMALFDRGDEDIFYVSAQLGKLYRTQDAGTTWSTISPTNKEGNWRTPFVMDPNTTRTLYAGYDKLYRSTNRGSNWTMVYDHSGKATWIEIAPSNSDVIFLCTGRKLERSTDKGVTWTDVSPGDNFILSSLAIHQTDENRMWLTTSTTGASTRVYFSDEQGTTWQNGTGGLPDIPANASLHVDGYDNLVFVGTDIGVFYRHDALNDWQLFGTVMPNVIVEDLELSRTGNELLAGTFGRGLWEASLCPDAEIDIANQTVDAAPNQYNVFISKESFCDWNSTINCDWVALSKLSGTGSDIVTVNVEPNMNTTARKCTLFIAGERHIVTQEAADVCNNCNNHDFSLQPTLSWQTHSSNHGVFGCKTYEVDLIAGNNYIFKTGCGNGANAAYPTVIEIFDANCNAITGLNNNCATQQAFEYFANENETIYVKVKGENHLHGDYTLAYMRESLCAGCTPISGLSVSILNDNGVRFDWNACNLNGVEYLLQYRVQGASVWQSVNTIQNTYSATDIDFCADYEARIGAFCDGIMTYSSLVNFSTNQGQEIDLAVVEIIEPTNFKGRADCPMSELSSSNTVTVQLRNSGSRTIQNPILNLSIDGVLVESEVVNVSLASGQTSVFSFNNSIDMSASGEHILSIWTTNTRDCNRVNNEVTKMFVNRENTEVTLPYNMNWNLGGTETLNEPEIILNRAEDFDFLSILNTDRIELKYGTEAAAFRKYKNKDEVSLNMHLDMSNYSAYGINDVYYNLELYSKVGISTQIGRRGRLVCFKGSKSKEFVCVPLPGAYEVTEIPIPNPNDMVRIDLGGVFAYLPRWLRERCGNGSFDIPDPSTTLQNACNYEYRKASTVNVSELFRIYNHQFTSKFEVMLLDGRNPNYCYEGYKPFVVDNISMVELPRLNLLHKSDNETSTIDRVVSQDIAFPNPFDDNLNVNIDDPESVSQVKIIDASGKLVYQLSNEGIDNEVQINTSEWAAGAYKLMIEGEQSQSFNLIKQ